MLPDSFTWLLFRAFRGRVTLDTKIKRFLIYHFTGFATHTKPFSIHKFLDNFYYFQQISLKTY